MNDPTINPFADLEAKMSDPPADGVFLTWVEAGSPYAEAGLDAGDLIVELEGEAGPDWPAFVKAHQPSDDGPKTRRAVVRSTDGSTRDVDVPVGMLAHFGRAPIGGCSLEKGKPGWPDLEESDHEPDFSSLADGTEIVLRNSMGPARAGYELISLAHEGDRLRCRLRFRLGGDDGKGGTWGFGSLFESVHRLDRILSVEEMSYREGEIGAERLTGDIKLEGDRWVGVRGGPDGARIDYEATPVTTHATVNYAVTLLPLTMPRREGAVLTFCSAGLASGIVRGRDRIVCLGTSTAMVDGIPVDTWAYEWQHYGKYACEQFHVADDRLVRVDWGPNYGGCWAEAVPMERLLEGVPAHVTLDEWPGG